jgi:hypothetical protein
VRGKERTKRSDQIPFHHGILGPPTARFLRLHELDDSHHLAQCLKSELQDQRRKSH